MPGKIESGFEITNALNSSYNHGIMDPDALSGGNGIYTMNAMGAFNPERYLSSESVETNSSSESNTNFGSIQHRKDHEFIPTRMKQINASKPAADPKQFTRVPSNPLLVSAQKQLMLVEEDKRAKELASKPKIKGGDDEPDWQNNLSTWKSRRRKQSEEALQRVSEVKALNDEENEPQTRSIGRKLSNLLYTAPEDDWSDLGLERNPRNYESDPERRKSESRLRSSSRSSLVSPPLIENDDSEYDLTGEGITQTGTFDVAPNTSEAKYSSTVFKQQLPPVLQKFSNKIDDQVEKKTETIEKVDVGSSIGVGVLNKKFSETSLTDMKPVVTYTNKENTAPPVRRKSSELSNTMKSRLEAFISPQQVSQTDGREKPVDSAPEPDEKFHEKLQTFRKISEGTNNDDVPKKPKPPLSYSSLIGNNPSQWNHRTLQSVSDDDDDNVDKMLDDALEESYRSVLEADPDTKDDSLKNQEVFKGDFLNSCPSRKAPPAEKPPPPPPAEPVPLKKDQAWNQKARHQIVDEEVDKQEQEIIASLENEEKVHKKYMETKQAMRGIPPVPHEEKFPKKSASPISDDIVSNKLTSSKSQPQLVNTATNINQVVPKKRMSEDGNQKVYNNQHWLIQEAEQRRLSDLKTKKSSVSPASSSPASSVVCQSSPVYENLNHKAQTSVSNSSYTNHQRPALPSAHPEVNWTSHTSRGNMYPQENLYANLGVIPSNEGSPPLINRESLVNPSRLPGPQVPPRLQPDRPLSSDGGKTVSSGERMLSVSGKKKCSHCKQELGRGAAMIIESLRLFYHLRCFQCCVCHLQLGNGTAGTDVRVRNNKLHCQNCYSNDEGLKFSKV